MRNRNKKTKMYEVIENLEIQNFGNPNIPKYCQVHCGHDDMLFTALYWADLEMGISKDSLPA